MKTLLLVDDVPANLGVLVEVLHEAGYDVRVAESGERALEQMKRVRADLVLLDIMMPGLDGFETCRRLKAQPEWRPIPVIFMTALDDVVDKVRGFDAGAVDYITKPLYPQEALARVRTHLELRELQTNLEDEVRRRHSLEQQLQQSLDRAVLMVAEDGSVPFCTQRAQLMLAGHCRGPVDGELPAELRPWLKTAAGDTLMLQTPAGTLRARRFAEAAAGDFCVLLLEEESSVSPSLEPLAALGLTTREAEVLYWISQGKTNPEIAILLSSATNTVKKHAQNVLGKLRVETRTAAARIALSVLGARELA